MRTEGYLPQDTAAEELTVAAGRECVTNCIKHAGGDEVQIRIAERNEFYDIAITNSGMPPTDKIREGSVQLVLMDVQTQHKHSGLAAAVSDLNTFPLTAHPKWRTTSWSR